MLTTVEAEIYVDGKVVLLEPLPVKTKSRVLVTLLTENSHKANEKTGNVSRILEFLQNNRLPDEARPTNEDMETQISENRTSWD